MREAEARACGALIVHQLATCRIGNRGVREQQLARRKAAAAQFGDPRPVAKEGDLHTDRCPACLQPSCEVPPLGPVLGMTAVVARKTQRAAALDPGIGVGVSSDYA